MRLHILCPNCGKPAVASHKRQQSALVTDVSYNCRNPACGAGFVCTVEVRRYLRLPSYINPAVYVPLSPIVEKRQLADAIQRLHTVDLPEGEMFDFGQKQRDIFQEAAPHGP